MKPKVLRDKFTTARYQFSIATDMGSFLSMVNKDDPFLTWRVDWYIAWRDGRYTPKAKLRTYLRNAVKNDFIGIYHQLNKDAELVKVAECSNFASHAIAILLNDQKIVDEYNICLASIGRALNHTIVILLPKKSSLLAEGWQTPTTLPKGMLIVDPWAMTMGYNAEVSLAVKPKHYVYSTLLERISLPYQSMNDPTIPQKMTISALDSEVTTRSMGKISMSRKLELEHRLFSTTTPTTSQLDLESPPEPNTQSTKPK